MAHIPQRFNIFSLMIYKLFLYRIVNGIVGGYRGMYPIVAQRIVTPLLNTGVGDIRKKFMPGEFSTMYATTVCIVGTFVLHLIIIIKS